MGAMDDRFLGRDRPMGEARLLWEIGPGGADLRALRSRLGLDSGYLSRLMRSLEADGLVTTAPSAADRRIRRAALTPAGLTEREVLDERSDVLAESLLEPLSQGQRAQLVEAMEQVERLLTAATVQLQAVDPGHPDAERCLAAYRDELARRTGLDPATSLPVEPGSVRPPRGLTLVAYRDGTPIGCGALKEAAGPPEIKRVWVSPDARGLGLGRRLMRALESAARDAGSEQVRLDTNRELTEAIAMYRATGYEEVEPYNEEPFAHHWFAKRLLRRPLSPGRRPAAACRASCPSRAGASSSASGRTA